MINDNARFKFRVWDKEEKHMHYIPAAELYEDLFLRADGVLCNVDYSDRRPMNNRYEVSFSTGLLDCDGKEIFEGDVVVRTDDESIKLFIEFRLGGFRALLHVAEEDGAHLTQITHYSNSKWKVIGNRFENPELLEIKND